MIELVIKIPEELYNHIMNDNVYFLEDGEKLHDIVKNGISLPKGHGRLKDVDAIIKKSWDADCRCGYVQVVDVGEILEATTIIEADVPKRRKGTPLEENDSGYNFENWIP